jgi:hypothetical protein
VLELRSSPASISQGATVEITAMVSDPDGIADLLGGTLLRDSDGSLYGAFHQVSGGTFTASLSWAQLDALEPIEFEGTASRRMRAEFLDQAGHKGWAALDLPLSCPAHAACAGACVDLASDANHCGSCATTCDEAGGVGGCAARHCMPSLSLCFDPEMKASCAAVCGGEGSTCVAGGCNGFTLYYFPSFGDCPPPNLSPAIGKNIACDAPLESSARARCCCAP